MLLTAASIFAQSLLLFSSLEEVSNNLYLNQECLPTIQQWNQTSCLAVIPLYAEKRLDKFLDSYGARQAFSSPNTYDPRLTYLLSHTACLLGSKQIPASPAELRACCVQASQTKGGPTAEGRTHLSNTNLHCIEGSVLGTEE